MQSTRSRHKRKGGVGSTIALLLLGILLLAGVAWYCYTQLVPHIETDLTERVTNELTSKGISSALVEVDGTDVILTGTVESSANAREAEQIALGVYGVTNVQNNLNADLDNSGLGETGDNNTVDSNTTDDDATDETTNAIQTSDSQIDVNSNSERVSGDTSDDSVAVESNALASNELASNEKDKESNSADSGPSLEVNVVNDKATAGGVLPETTMSLRVASALAAKYGEDNVENSIVIVPETPSPSWLDGAISIIERIDNIDNPSLIISEDSATLGGSVSSETLGAQQLSAAKRALGNDVEVSGTFAILQRDSELPAPENTPRQAKKRPASLRVESRNGSIGLSGSVSSVEEADTIRVDLGEVLEDADYTDELIIDDSVASADWINEALAVIDNVKDVSNFSVSINSGQMMLGGDITNRETGKTLAGTATRITDNKLNVVNNYSVNQAELVIESREEVLARELSQKLAALETSKIVFNPGSAELADDAIEVLDAVAATIAGYSDQVVEISGHTDTSGDSVINLELSKKRAIAVRDYLVSKGLASAQLRPIGYGESNPVADNSTPAGRAANRRIEFNL